MIIIAYSFGNEIWQERHIRPLPSYMPNGKHVYVIEELPYFFG